MSEIEDKGQKYLRKWLSGEITYSDELELFRLAEDDEILQAALEGYIGQSIYEPAGLPVHAAAVLGKSKPEPARRRRTFAWLRYVAGIALLMAVSIPVWRQVNDQPSKAVAIQENKNGLDAPQDRFNIYNVSKANSESPGEIDATGSITPSGSEQPVYADYEVETHQVAKMDREAPVDATAEKVLNAEGQPAEVLAFEEAPSKEETGIISIHDESLLSDQVSGSPQNEPDHSLPDALSVVDAVVEVDSESPGLEPIALQFSNEGEENLIRQDAVRNKDENDDDVIKGYEIDIRSGVSPTDYMVTGPEFDSTQLAGNGAIDARVQLADASTTSKGQVKSNRLNNNVVITEYKIEKRDLANPPIADYNSLVREKYKRKARPEIGFFKYKQYLRESTACLREVYRSVDYLEEAVIKFRVHQDGNIEFIELFGVTDNACVSDIHDQIVSGPSWNVADPYQSIDVEVPFKVLHPYWY